MRNFYFMLLVLIFMLASCAKEPVKINPEKINAPSISIINLKDGEIIKGSRISVKLNVSNFKLVTPDTMPKNGQGHVQVWVDDMEFRGSKTEFVFENESRGNHTIKAELMLSNNTILPYSKTIRVFLSKT